MTLEKRSTFRLRQKGAPFYAVYNSGAYTFAPYKVVWAELSTTFEAAVLESSNVPLVGRRPYVPDHKVYFADFTSKDMVHFVCGILNSKLIQEYVESHTIQIQVSNIFKYLSIPQFEPKNKIHVELVKLSKAAHAATSKASRNKLLAKISAKAETIIKA